MAEYERLVARGDQLEAELADIAAQFTPSQFDAGVPDCLRRRSESDPQTWLSNSTPRFGEWKIPGVYSSSGVLDIGKLEACAALVAVGDPDGPVVGVGNFVDDG